MSPMAWVVGCRENQNPQIRHVLLANKSGWKLNAENRLREGQQRSSKPRLPTRAERVDVICREKASGKSIKGLPKLEKAIDEPGTGDVLAQAEWDRCTRSSAC